MSIAIRIDPALHRAIPSDIPVSTTIRNLLTNAVESPEAIVSAIASRLQFTAPATAPATALAMATQRYTIYMPDSERDAATITAARLTLSLNQLIQILLEDTLFRAGRWPTHEPKE